MRLIKPIVGTKQFNRDMYENELAMSGVVRENSYFSEETGAYSIYMEGHNYVAEEIEAAKILADEGYITILTPENIELYATRKTKNGVLKYSDGLISDLSYEQKTPKPSNDTKEGRVNSVNNALQHARDKGSKVAVIYDKYASFYQEDIEDGINLFESKNKYRFEGIIVINTVHKKKANEWYHNS